MRVCVYSLYFRYLLCVLLLYAIFHTFPILSFSHSFICVCVCVCVCVFVISDMQNVLDNGWVWMVSLFLIIMIPVVMVPHPTPLFLVFLLYFHIFPLYFKKISIYFTLPFFNVCIYLLFTCIQQHMSNPSWSIGKVNILCVLHLQILKRLVF